MKKLKLWLERPGLFQFGNGPERSSHRESAEQGGEGLKRVQRLITAVVLVAFIAPLVAPPKLAFGEDGRCPKGYTYVPSTPGYVIPAYEYPDYYGVVEDIVIDPTPEACLPCPNAALAWLGLGAVLTGAVAMGLSTAGLGTASAIVAGVSYSLAGGAAVGVIQCL